MFNGLSIERATAPPMDRPPNAGARQQRVFILGANGFVGRHVVSRLSADGTHLPVAGVRRLPQLMPRGVEMRICDGRDLQSIRAAMAGCDFAVNCVLGSSLTMLQTTANLFRAAGELSLKRVVEISSIAVHGSREGLVTENTLPDENAGPYARAKIRCERIVHRARHLYGIEAVVLRPGLVHGPGGDQWTRRIGALLRRRRIGDLGPNGDGTCNLISVAEVADAVVAALSRPLVDGRAFFLADPTPMTWNEYLDFFANAAAISPCARISNRTLLIETKLYAPPLKASQMLLAKMGLSSRLVADPIPPSLLRLFRQRVRFDSQPADDLLRFQRVPREQAIRQAAQWFTNAALPN